MIENHYKWNIKKDIPLNKNNISPIVQKILYNRGYTTPEEMEKFLSISDEDIMLFHYLRPYDLPDMLIAVGAIWEAIYRNEPIAIYGDYDADGVTATTILYSFMQKIGVNVIRYIPDRFDEGYGVNYAALQSLFDAGYKFVITVDCGSKSVDEIAKFKTIGGKVVVTDHHEIGETIPDCIAVINPQRHNDAELKGICGAGVAFHLLAGLLQYAWRDNGAKDNHINNYEEILNKFVDLAAIGTVTDIMPLNNILNRIIVKRGLKMMRTSTRTGIDRLLFKANVGVENISATTIGFVIGPRLNAAGRMEKAMIACDLLLEENPYIAEGIAAKLEDLNKQRQRDTLAAVTRAKEYIEANNLMQNSVIIINDDQISAGIVGLVAGKLTEQFYRPSIVFERGKEFSKASCRSIPEFHITSALKEHSDYLVRYGGHAMAAGLTIETPRLLDFQQAMINYAGLRLNVDELIPKLDIDEYLDIAEINLNIVAEIGKLEPFGHQNQSPLFITRQAQVVDFKTMGDGKHLKLMLTSPVNHNQPIEAVFFSKGSLAENMSQFVDIVFYVEINEWGGDRRLQLNIQDMKTSEMII